MTQRRAVQRQIDDGEPDSLPSAGSASAARTADVLRQFILAGSKTLGVSELSRDLKLPKAAVHRILVGLRSRDFVYYDRDSSRYGLGYMAMILGLSYLDHVDVRRIALHELRLLSDRTNETSTLSLRTGDSRVYVEQELPSREVIMSVRVGEPFPLHAGGSSKAFLAFLSDDEISAYFGNELVSLTPNTITDTSKLWKELIDVRKRGFARSYGERQVGAASVAAPIFDRYGYPAAVISICGPAERFAEESDACAEILLEVTQRLSRRMGYIAE